MPPARLQLRTSGGQLVAAASGDHYKGSRDYRQVPGTVRQAEHLEEACRPCGNDTTWASTEYS